MRVRLLAVLVAALLAAFNVSSVFADTGGGGTDLGLEAVTISGGTVIARTGQVTLAGSITCTQDLDASVFVDFAQVVGRLNTIEPNNIMNDDARMNVKTQSMPAIMPPTTAAGS